MSGPVDALVVIDAQAGLLQGAGAVPGAKSIRGGIAALLGAARAAGATVVHLQNDGAPGAADEPGTAGWSIVTEARPAAAEPLLRKTVDDGFVGTALEALLRTAGARRLAVAGVLTEMCVSATIRTALALGFEVVLASGAHGTYDLEDIPAETVARVAVHALGDTLEVAPAGAIRFRVSSARTAGGR